MATPKKAIERLRASVARHKQQATEVGIRAGTLATGAATGAAIGAARGKFGTSEGRLLLPKTEIDADLALGLLVGGLGAVGMVPGGKTLQKVAVEAGSAALAVYSDRTVERMVKAKS